MPCIPELCEKKVIQELDWSCRGENNIGVKSLSPKNVVIIDDQNWGAMSLPKRFGAVFGLKC